MATHLKSFRLDRRLIPFLESFAKAKGVSEATIIEMALEKLMEDTEQWENDLALIAKDDAYRKEQVDLADEFYEDF